MYFIEEMITTEKNLSTQDKHFRLSKNDCSELLLSSSNYVLYNKKNQQNLCEFLPKFSEKWYPIKSQQHNPYGWWLFLDFHIHFYCGIESVVCCIAVSHTRRKILSKTQNSYNSRLPHFFRFNSIVVVILLKSLVDTTRMLLWKCGKIKIQKYCISFHF